MSDAPLKQTVLHDVHVRLGGRMVPFAGYDMPVQYESILAEVRAVRSGCGIFDVSHMARIFVEGAGARALLDWIHTANVGEKMPIGRARYGLVCNEAGGIIDDGIVYRLAEERFMLIANAGNAAEVYAWLTRWRDERFSGVTLDDATARIAMIAIQGPTAWRIAEQITNQTPDTLRPFRITECVADGNPALVACTGYTGEDGVELMPPSEHAEDVWDRLVEHGATPCGLGSRDTLRLEAGLLLHGSDMDQSVNPIEAGLERFVAMDRDFCGAAAIRAAAEQGTKRKLAGFIMAERGAIPRAHAPIVIDGHEAGQVSSGAYSPTLDTTLGLGYVPALSATPGATLQIDVRGKLLEAHIVDLPFYSRPR